MRFGTVSINPVTFLLLLFVTWLICNCDDDGGGFDYLAKIISEVAHYDICLLLCLCNTI